MPETGAPNVINPKKRDPKRTSKICENLPYSGREAFKRLRTNVLIALNQEKKCQVIGVTSAQPSEGKSTITINLAYSLAELKKSVLLIDGDMRRPTVHSAVGCEIAPGLSEILSGSQNLKDSIVRYKSRSDDTCFDLIPGGSCPDNPSELLNSSRFQKLLEVVSNVYDYVLVDLPPVNAVVDAVNASKYTDGLVVVIRENHCPRFVLDTCLEQLRYAKANILGFVMNGCVEGSGKRYQYNQPYYYRSDR